METTKIGTGIYLILIPCHQEDRGTKRTSLRSSQRLLTDLFVYLRKENVLVLIGETLRLLGNFSSDNGEIIRVTILTRTFTLVNRNIRMFVLHHMNHLVPRHIQMIIIVRLDGYLIKTAVTYGQVKRGHTNLLLQLARDIRIRCQS